MQNQKRASWEISVEHCLPQHYNLNIKYMVPPKNPKEPCHVMSCFRSPIRGVAKISHLSHRTEGNPRVLIFPLMLTECIHFEPTSLKKEEVILILFSKGLLYSHFLPLGYHLEFSLILVIHDNILKGYLSRATGVSVFISVCLCSGFTYICL